MPRTFNPPPGWPPPPPDWKPGPNWQPNPSWPTPPVGWPFWIDEPTAPLQVQSGQVGGPGPAVIAITAAAATAILSTATKRVSP
jgi:hypothetical protein